MVAIISTISETLGISAWLLWLTIFLLALYIYGTWNHATFQRIGVAGPKPWPLFGNMPELAKSGFRMDRKMIKKYGRVYGYYEAVTPVVVVGDPEYIKQITVKHFDHFMDRRNIVLNKDIARSVTMVKGDDWRTIRNVMTPTFSGGKLKKMVSSISDCSDRLIDNLNKFAATNEMVEIRNVVGCFTMDVVAETLFGIKIDSQANYQNEFVQKAKKAFEEFNAGNLPLMITFFFPIFGRVMNLFGISVALRESTAFFTKTIRNILDVRKDMKEKPNDYLQLLLDAHADESHETTDEKISALEETDDIKQWKITKRALTEEEVIANSLLFFLGGYETTASAVGWMVYNLAINEDVQEKLHEDVVNVLAKHNLQKPNYESIAKMTYLDQVFCESLRLFPPTERADRSCTKDCDIGPYHFRKGDVINISIIGVHHNEEFWPEPEKFDPDRFSPENRSHIVPYTYMPFGVGPRNCIGLRLATLEAKMAMAEIIKHFKIKRCEKTEVPIKLKTVGFSIPVNGIWVRLEKRQ